MPRDQPEGKQCNLVAGHPGVHQAASSVPEAVVRPRRRVLPAILLTGVLVIVALVALGGSTTRPGGEPAAGVLWADYAPEVRTRIDALARSRDCAALQAEFDNADANSAATLNRTGHNNAALMGYIDGRMRDAGCY